MPLSTNWLKERVTAPVRAVVAKQQQQPHQKKKHRKGTCSGMHGEYEDFQISWGLGIFENQWQMHHWPTNMTKTQQHACLSQGFFQCWACLFDDSFGTCLQHLINSSTASTSKQQITMQKQNINPPINSYKFPIKYKHQLRWKSRIPTLWSSKIRARQHCFVSK